MTRLLLAALATYLVSPIGLTADPAIPTGKQKVAFDIKSFEQFINHELSRPKPGCSMAEMGIPGRRVEGQLVDADGKPMDNVVVGIAEPIGFSGKSYFDNFDVTDNQGRYVVDGSVAKTRLIFRKPTGQIWPVQLKPDDRVLRVTWPQSSQVILEIPNAIATPDADVSIQTKNYWSGMAVMRHTAKIDQDGVAVFNDVIPGDYYATINKSIKVAADEQTRAIEIAQFKVAAGEGLTVPCGNNGVTVITGTLADKPNPGGIKLNMYVMIERIKRDYVHMPPAGDMLNFDDDGKFQSRPLAPGHYLVRYMAKGMGRGRFGPVGDSAVKTWRVNVDGKSDKIDVAEIQPPSEAGKFVENLLQRALAAPRRGGNYAQQVKSAAFRGGAELMLLRIMSNPEAPYPWRRQIPEMLQSLTDSPRVITGLFDAIKNPVNKRELAQVIRAFQTSTIRVDEIVSALEPLVTDHDHIARGVTIRVLGELATKNEAEAARIAVLLQQGLSDSWEATRLTAADYLGRLEAKPALESLKEARQDVSGDVAVMAAFATWKITGDPEDVYPTMKSVLQRDGLVGKWHASYFMKTVAEQHPVPGEMKPVLEKVAKGAGKPPFRSSFDYEKSRAGKAAQQMLESISAR